MGEGTGVKRFATSQQPRAEPRGRKGTHISVEREIALCPILSSDDTVATVDPGDYSTLELIGGDDFHRHDGLQHDYGSFLHGYGVVGVGEVDTETNSIVFG